MVEDSHRLKTSRARKEVRKMVNPAMATKDVMTYISELSDT